MQKRPFNGCFDLPYFLFHLNAPSTDSWNREKERKRKSHQTRQECKSFASITFLISWQESSFQKFAPSAIFLKQVGLLSFFITRFFAEFNHFNVRSIFHKQCWEDATLPRSASAVALTSLGFSIV